MLHVLRKSEPNSDSAVDVATSFKMAQVTYMLSLRMIGFLLMGRLPRKPYPPMRLLFLPVDK